jgi:thioesterase domain-containing protein
VSDSTGAGGHLGAASIHNHAFIHNHALRVLACITVTGVLIAAPGCGAIYDEGLNELRSDGHEVVSIEWQEGMLASEFLDTAAKAIQDALAELPDDAGPVIFTGHSMGGAVAAALAEQWQERNLPVPDLLFVWRPCGGLYNGELLQNTYADVPCDVVSVMGLRDNLCGNDQVAQRLAETADSVEVVEQDSDHQMVEDDWQLLRDRLNDDGSKAVIFFLHGYGARTGR